MSEIISSLLEYFLQRVKVSSSLSQSYKIPSSHASIPLYLFSIPLRSTLNDKRSKSPPSVHLSRQKSTKHGQEVNPFSMDLGDGQVAKDSAS